ncbi:MAG: hypothetical protein CMO80_05115 [Verrucomicrobiales bacterium]|nr:hypothetical protein [Verrucomicrobiales bacterium]|tara:strand:- start:2862 stop:3335 length:474 start_codon:yes stop_codon:yes gene_type:complete
MSESSKPNRNPVSQILDRLGFFASSLCAVHCVCMPWLLIALPLLAGTWLVDREIERGFVIASIFLATACTVGGCRTHGRWWLLGLLGTGAAALIGAHATAPPICCADELSWPHALGAAFGGSLLAATHFLNLRLQSTPTLVPAADCCDSVGCSGNRL